MQPNEEGLETEKSWGYKIWPILNPECYIEPRTVPNYNKDWIY